MSLFEDEQPTEEPREETRETFYLKNFLGFFEKRQIRLKTVYMVEDRIIFLHVSYGNSCNDLWIYVTSEHDINPDGINIPKIKLIQQEEDYKLPSGTAKIKEYLSQQIEIVQSGKIKLLNAGKKFIVYITRHNEIDFFELADSPSDRGFYFMTEWTYFFEHSRDIPSSLKRLEINLVEYAYDHLHSHETDIIKANKTVQEVIKSIPKGSEVPRALLDRSRKCDRLFEQNASSAQRSEQKSSEIQQLSSAVRHENLQKAFETFIISNDLIKIQKMMS
jgi:hypothetical protein